MRLRPLKQGGFTLIEVLVVIMIIALVSGGMLITLTSGGPALLLEREAQRFRLTMQVATDRAMLANEELGLVVDGQQYQFVRWEGEAWAPISNSKALATYELDETIGLELTLDGLPWQEESLFESDGLFENAFEEEEDEEIKPQVFIYSYGEFTDFSLAFSWIPLEDEQPETVTVQGQIDQVTIVDPDADPESDEDFEDDE